VFPLAFCPAVAGLDADALDVDAFGIEQLDAAASGSTIGNGLFINS
jgi:hypothetical protein